MPRPQSTLEFVEFVEVLKFSEFGNSWNLEYSKKPRPWLAQFLECLFFLAVLDIPRSQDLRDNSLILVFLLSLDKALTK